MSVPSDDPVRAVFRSFVLSLFLSSSSSFLFSFSLSFTSSSSFSLSHSPPSLPSFLPPSLPPSLSDPVRVTLLKAGARVRAARSRCDSVCTPFSCRGPCTLYITVQADYVSWPKGGWSGWRWLEDLSDAAHARAGVSARVCAASLRVFVSPARFQPLGAFAGGSRGSLSSPATSQTDPACSTRTPADRAVGEHSG